MAHPTIEQAEAPVTRGSGSAAASRPRPFGATWFLSVYVVLLLAVPAPLKVGALGSAGHPASLVALAALLWWTWDRVNRVTPVAHLEPIRVAAVGLVVAVLAAYAHAMAQPIPADELSPADAGLLRVLGFCGLVLVATDGIDSWERAWTLARRMCWGVAVVAALAIVQGATGQLWVDRLSLPGLEQIGGALELGSRGQMARPSGTATHSIELGAVLAMAFPLVVAVARVRRQARWWLVLAVAFGALLLVLSRTALIAAVVGMLVLAPGWSRRARLAAAVVAGAGLAAAFVLVPGLIGTLRGMFMLASGDPSVQSRTESYGIAGRFVAENPLLGHGYGTFLPKYWILDNFYLQFLVETGLVGLLALTGLLAVALHSSRRATRLVSSTADAELARGAGAAVAAGAVALVFFDALSFPQSAGFLFLAVGLCGACRRLATSGAQR